MGSANDIVSLMAHTRAGDVQISFHRGAFIALIPKIIQLNDEVHTEFVADDYSGGALTWQLEQLPAILAEVLVSWDVVMYEGGPPEPIALATLHKLPTLMIFELIQAMLDEVK